jgi:superoxide dismutase, Fe-Mn family
MAYQLPALNYSYDALEPCIDSETMRLHHDKHHRGYIDVLNKALANYPQFRHTTIEDLLGRLNDLPEEIRDVVRHSGGGHANHQLLWDVIGPPNGAKPKGLLAEAIRNDFGTFENLQEKLMEAATKVFGSGWAFLAIDARSQKLEVMSLPNQNSPLLYGKSGLLACDVWEHSYYLKYQNRRPDYLQAWWNVVQWDAVNRRLESFCREALVKEVSLAVG